MTTHNYAKQKYLKEKVFEYAKYLVVYILNKDKVDNVTSEMWTVLKMTSDLLDVEQTPACFCSLTYFNDKLHLLVCLFII